MLINNFRDMFEHPIALAKIFNRKIVFRLTRMASISCINVNDSGGIHICQVKGHEIDFRRWAFSELGGKLH